MKQCKEKTIRMITFFTLLLMFMSTLLAGTVDGQSKDITGHWAENEINKWESLGLAKGSLDHTFKPNDDITRAEFIAFINRIFNFIDQSDHVFNDVNENAWYADEISKAFTAGILKGDGHGNVNPDVFITRQEAAIILARVFNLQIEDSQAADSFVDAEQIAPWARDAVDVMIENGYISGRPGNIIAPLDHITRAESVKMIDNVMGNLINIAGTYNESVDGNLVVNTENVKLKDLTISGDLYITQGVADGTVILEGVTVKGKTFVNGGGEHSIIINNSSLEGTLVVLKKDGKIRIVTEGSSEISRLHLNSGAKLQEQNLTGKGFGNVEVITVQQGQEIVLDGDFEELIIEESGTSINVTSGTIGNLQISEGAAGTNIIVSKQATIENFTANASTTVTGEGTITNTTINAEDVIIELSEEREQKDLTPPPSSGGSGGGDEGEANTVKVSAISVSPETMTLTAGGETGTLVATITPANATNQNVTWTSGNEAVATVANGVVTPVSAGTATITVTTEDGNYTATCDVTVNAAPVAVTGVTLDQVTMTLTAGGETGTLVATITPANATNQNVTWTSSNETVATVANGVVTPVSAGTATITVTTEDGGKMANCEVIVEEAYQNIETELAVIIADEQGIWISVWDKAADETILGLSKENFSLTNTLGNVDFNFNDPSLRDANVPEHEYLLSPMTGEFSGTYTLSFNKAGYLSTSIEIEINTDATMGEIVSISFSPNSYTAGVEHNISVTVETYGLVDGTEITLSLIGDSVEDIIVEPVSGVISNNTATINITVPNTVEAGIYYFEAKATDIYPLYQTVTFTAPEQDKEITAVKLIDDITVDYGTILEAVGLPTSVEVTLDDSSTRQLEVNWDCGTPEYNGDIAGTYEFEGVLTLEEGIANTAGFKATVKVIVNDEVVPVTGVTLDQGTMTLTAGGETGTLLATITPANATNQNVTWTSSNESVATVADGVVTPVAEGTATITVTTEDGSYTAACEVTVNALNHPPVANDDTADVDEDSTVLVDVLINDTDVDGDTLSITAFTQGTNGTVSQEGDSLRYTPNADYNGVDSFTYEISDGNGGITTATVNVTINPVNDLPVANDDTVTVDEDSTVLVDVLINDTDIDGDTLSITAFTQGTNGTVSQEGDSLRYTPNADYNGVDSFTYDFSDGKGGTDTATVNVTINPVNDLPVANDDTVTVDEDSTVLVDVLINDTDVDGDTLSITAFTQGTNGTVSQEGDSLRYTPNTDYNGADSFMYEIGDGNGGITTATVNVNVNAAVVINPEGDLLDSDSGSDFIGVLYLRDGNIFYSEADSNGIWSNETLLGTGTEGRIAVDDLDHVHVVYTTNGKIAYTMFDGTTWTTEEFIESNNGGTCSKPDIAVDSSGYAHITYTDTMGQTGGYTEKPDIMYATNATGGFINEVIFNGYYEHLYGSCYIGAYYEKGSFITMDNNDNYYIATHVQDFYKPDMQVAERTYSVTVGSNLGNGSTTTDSSDIFDIYDLTSDGDKVVALYKQSAFKTSELIVSETTINFANTVDLTGTSVNSVVTDGTNVVVGGTSSSNLQIYANGIQQVIPDTVVKDLMVSVVNVDGMFYAIYTDDNDGMIKVIELVG